MVTYTRIAAAIRAKTLIVERLLRLGTLLVANDAGGEKKTAILKMLTMLNIFGMILEGGAKVLIVLESVVIVVEVVVPVKSAVLQRSLPQKQV